MRESLSSDLNQLVFGVGFVDTSLLRWLDTCDTLELFCDGIRLGIGLAFGVDKRRRDAISVAYICCGGTNISTEFSFVEKSDLLDGGEVDFFFENRSFTCYMGEKKYKFYLYLKSI